MSEDLFSLLGRADFADDEPPPAVGGGLEPLRPLGVGAVLGEAYRLEAPLGAGAMGSVFGGRELATGRSVAIKIPARRTSERLRARFEREARAAARVDHPHVVAVHSYGAQDGTPYLVCELVEEARSLRELLPELPLARRLELLEQVAAGAGAAHAEGVVHRDLKPDNVLVSPTRGALLADFGIAHDAEELIRLTRTGEVVGTPSYMAPEQLQGLKELSSAVDVWALGVCLYEALYDELPFRGHSLAELVVQITGREPSFPARAGATPALVELCRRALAKDPAQRPADGASFARALAAARAQPPPRRSRVAFAAAGLLLVGLIGLALSSSPAAPRTASPTREAEPAGSSTGPARSPTPAPPRLQRWRRALYRQVRLHGEERVLAAVNGALLLCEPDGALVAELPGYRLDRVYLPPGVVESSRGLDLVREDGQLTSYGSVPARDLLACAGAPPRVIAWTRAERELHVRWEGELLPPRTCERPLTSLAVSEACVAIGDERALTVLSLPELALVGRHPVGSRLLRFSPEGERVAFGGRNGTAGVLDLRTGGAPLMLQREHPATQGIAGSLSVMAHLGSVRGVAWSADGRWVYTAGSSSRYGEGVAVWDARSGALRAFGLRTEGGYNSLDVAGEHLVLIGDDGQLYSGSVEAIERFERLADALR